jgi:hypothetical protein
MFHPNDERIRHASELTEQQIANLVLEDEEIDDSDLYHSDLRNVRETISNDIRHRTKCLHDVDSAYRQRRKEQRVMVKSYIERHARNNVRFPWPPDPLEDPLRTNNNHDVPVHLDMHGRLLRRTTPHLHENDENEKLIDAATSFWKLHTQNQNTSQSLTTKRDRNNLHFSAPTRLQHPNPPRVPLHQLQTQQFISEQMERDARHAIEQAIHRYSQREDTTDNDDGLYEFVSIPIRPREEAQTTRWFPRLRRQNHPPIIDGDNNNHDNPRIDNRLHQPPDIRLAFRRICFAVLTVVAAFLCTLFHDIPVYFDDAHVDSIWYSGLLGPHYEGHHSAKRQRLVYRSLEEGGFVAEEEMSRLDILWNELFGAEEEEEIGGEEFEGCENLDDDAMSMGLGLGFCVESSKVKSEQVQNE